MRLYTYSFLKWIVLTRLFSQRYYIIEDLEEQPNEYQVKDNIIYYIGSKDNKWCIIFKCPCGCRSIIYLNSLKRARPYWQLKVQDVSISPSINRVIGCKSHFFIKKHRVIWTSNMKT